MPRPAPDANGYHYTERRLVQIKLAFPAPTTDRETGNDSLDEAVEKALRRLLRKSGAI